MHSARLASLPPSGLFQGCASLGKRLGCVRGFEEELPRILPSRAAGSDTFDPVSDLWQYFRLGKPLCMLFNVYAEHVGLVPIPYAVESRLSNANACKALVMRFIIALKERLGWDTDDTFTVSQLFLNDTNGFVRVVRTVDRLLTLIEDHGLVHPHTPHPHDVVELSLVNDAGAGAPRDQRGHVGMELLESERKYVHDLEVLQAYASALSQHDIVSQDTMYHIFGNLDQLVDAQRRFLICLEQNAQKPVQNQQLSNIFRALEDDFSVYDLFCANYAHALQCINEERTALQKLSQIPGAHALFLEPTYELPTYLIKPVQRICKYPLLLEQLLKHTPEEATREREDLNDALTTIRRITDRVNETRRSQENEQLVKNLEMRVEDWKGHSLRTFGALLLCDTFTVSKGESEREFRVYLFEHILLCCKDMSTVTPARTRSKSGTRLRPRGGSLSESQAQAHRRSDHLAPLQLKGRIFLSNIVGAHVLGRQTAGSEALGPYILQVWWHGEFELESFCLKCKNEEQLRLWHTTLQRLLDEIRARRESAGSNISASSVPHSVTSQTMPGAPSAPSALAWASMRGASNLRSAGFMQVNTPSVAQPPTPDHGPNRLKRSSMTDAADALLGRTPYSGSSLSLTTSLNTPSMSECESPRDAFAWEECGGGILPTPAQASPHTAATSAPPPSSGPTVTTPSKPNFPSSGTASSPYSGGLPPRMPWRQMSAGNISSLRQQMSTTPAAPPSNQHKTTMPTRSSSVSGEATPSTVVRANPEFLAKEIEAMKVSRSPPTRLQGFAAARGGPPPMRIDMAKMQRTGSDSMALRSFMSPMPMTSSGTPASSTTIAAMPTNGYYTNHTAAAGAAPPPQPSSHHANHAAFSASQTPEWMQMPVSPRTEWNPYFPPTTGPTAPEAATAASAGAVAAHQNFVSMNESRKSAEALSVFAHSSSTGNTLSPSTRQNSSSGASCTSGSLWAHSAPHSPLSLGPVHVCVRYGAERTEMYVPSTVSFSELHASVHRQMGLPSDAHTRMYHIDEDGDRVMLLDDDDLATAMEHVRSLNQDPRLVIVIE